jgi:hypothetical protein
MRVFHFVSAKHGLNDIRHRRLKVATLLELNDPFELFGVALQDTRLRRALGSLKERFARTTGLLCFSRNWRNPVLWSHYAARHSGLCLGFDVPDDHLHLVSYSRKRLVVELEQLKTHAIDKATVIRFLFTKYAHWRYEAEARMFVNLAECRQVGGRYFADFTDELRLRTVIVGAHSSVTRQALRRALGNLAPAVNLIKARLAFKTFRVVTQRKASLWT